jgi:Asp-tRNA(Asn)/Glu-tRNA(Gln) amidotransferase A subunit family amidase
MPDTGAFALAGMGTVALGIALVGCVPDAYAPPFEVTEASIAEIQSAIASGATTCREVVQGYLDRIEALDRSTGLHAISMVNPRALATADSLDQVWARERPQGGRTQGGRTRDGEAGQLPSPLFCAPILVKDNFDTGDLPTTAGSVALAESIPAEDAFMVRRIREAGAIVLAKTNMAEWAFSPRQSVSSTMGTTANAYALDRTPAGSSGGTASGVAASFGVAGLGSDTGNSIRGPSSHAALVGIRSTLGLTSRAGVIPLAFDRDVAGPMGRTVEDVARIFSVVVGTDPRDPYTAEADAHTVADYTALLRPDALEGRRLGVLAPFVDPDDTDPEILAIFQRALAELRALGAEVVEGVDIPGRAELMQAGLFCRRFRHDMAQYLSTLPAPPMRDVVEVLETGAFGTDAEAGLRNALATPADLHPRDGDPTCPDFAEHQGRQALLAAVVAALDQDGLDAFVFPTWRYPPAPLATANEDYRGDNSQGLVPAAGLPALTIPMGFTDPGLPAGLQLVGRPWSDGALLAMGYAYEQATEHRTPPPGFPPLARIALAILVALVVYPARLRV